jgi:hypothetical protein
MVSLMGIRQFVDVPACESSPNANPQADCHQWHYHAGNSIAGEETSSVPILTPSNFNSVSLNQGHARQIEILRRFGRFAIERSCFTSLQWRQCAPRQLAQ